MSQMILPDFTLSNRITTEQAAFFSANGVIVFREFLDGPMLARVLTELAGIEKKWLEEGKEKINGIPLKFGKDPSGNRMIQRMCFLSLYSELLHNLLQDERVHALLELLLPWESRISETEKDGLILNHYIRHQGSVFSQMGWHTDSPRDIFLGQRIMPMLNVGIHLDDCLYEQGGLRVLPGTHKQGIFQMLFRKKYFTDNTPDPKEAGFNIRAGDLTVHNGRLWHRAQQSPFFGEQSRRRVLYIPIITGRYRPKTENSRTPFYHHFASRVQN